MKFLALTINQKALIVALAIYGLGIIVFALLMLLPVGIDLLLGWILGAAISLICFGLIVAQSYALTSGNFKNPSLVLFFFVIRFVLHGGGLALAAYLTYRAQIKLFNLFTVFGAYMPITLAIYIFGMFDKQKALATSRPKRSE